MEQSHVIMRQRLKQQEREKHEEAGQDQIKDKTQTQTTGQTQTAMQEHRDAKEQGGKQVQQQQRPVAGRKIVGQGIKQEEQEHQQEQQQEQSQIHDDWSKICKAVSSLSDTTLDDCVKRLNSSVFKKLSKPSEIKNDISIETFVIIMNEIDDDVKTQHVDKKIRKFIKKPVMLQFVFYFDLCFCFVVYVF